MRSLSHSLLFLLLSAVAFSQQFSTNSAAVVPTLVNFSGVVRDGSGNPLSRVVGVTFAMYKEAQGGSALWLETQSVQPDKAGHYSVTLGSTTSQGLPSDLFAAGEARWLGVQVEGQEEQERVLLLSVPYALKAADAQTLGGLPPSAFALAPASGANPSARTATASVVSSPLPSVSPSALSRATSDVTTTGGTAQHLSMFTTATNIQNSIVTQTGTTAIDVTGKLGVNTAAPALSLDVSSGNGIVRGVGNFAKTGDTGTLYVGDTNHPIEALFDDGLAIGVFKVPKAVFIADFTGIVGIGTTTSRTGMLNTAATVGTLVGLSASGWNATTNSGDPGTDAIHAKGGNADPNGESNGGAGAVITGGTGSSNGGPGANITGGTGFSLGNGGAGIVVTGGTDTDDFAGGDGIVANGGLFGGVGVVATGAEGDEFDPGVAGIMTTGGLGGGGVNNGAGIVATGATDSQDNGGDGIDAIAGTGSGSFTNGNAGSFTGNVNVSGNLTVSGTKHFKIDDPLDPANKYLYHASVESSEVLNLYSGNAMLDADGEATVQLPAWFDALNRDFRYQLTAIGAAAPNLHIAQEIENRNFKIAGGSAGMKVSWQVTAVRQDAWEKVHPMVVEVEKPQNERGYYINPELFGAPPQRSMDWARMPQVMKRLQTMHAKQLSQKQATLLKPAKTVRP